MSLGLIGFGAFGQLAARHLALHCELLIHDPDPSGDADFVALSDAAACERVILAVPVQAMAEAAKAIAPHVREGARIYDVGSVKIAPMQALRENLPGHVEIVGTHPLFGPQSARDGLTGLPIVLCPDDGVDCSAEHRFLSQQLELEVHTSDAQTHDRVMARVQGVTHLIAKVISGLDPAGAPYTTKSYDLLVEAAGLVSDDSDALFHAIEELNPHAGEVREQFFESVKRLSDRFDSE